MSDTSGSAPSATAPAAPETAAAVPTAPEQPAAQQAPRPARPVPAESRTPDPRTPVPPQPSAPKEAARRAPGESQEAPPKTDGSWFQRFLKPGSRAPEKAQRPASESPSEGPSAPQEPPEQEQPSAPWAPPSSREEEERRVQAEVDRRAARAQKAQAQQTRAQQRALLEQQEREARQTDVYKATELREQLDAMAAQEQFVAGLVGAYDQSTLDPLVGTLPEAERKALLEDVPTGMEGRKALVEKAVQAIKAQGAREAEARLRKSAAFRKQVLADWRRGVHGDDDAPDPHEEPELVASGVGTNGHRGGPSMNDWLRASAR